MSKYITKVTSIYFVDDLGDEKFIWKCTALPNAYTICEILNADLIKNGMYSIWKYKELIEKNLQISDLEAKLAEMETEIKSLSSEISTLEQDLTHYRGEVFNLKDQLAEKDKEIEKLKQRLKATIKIYSDDFVKKDKELKELKFKVSNSDQDKISFAVEQLEKVKELAHNHIKKIANDLSEEYDERLNQKHVIHGLETAITDINNQIEELKKEMK